MNTIEVCLSPALYEFHSTTEEYIVVIVDVLRATTSFCAAFDSGVEIIIPVQGLDELLEYKNKGYYTAAEREGEKVDFADFGNSPSVFLKSSLIGKQLAYSTTNGTKAVELAKRNGNIAAAAFVNLQAMSHWLSVQQKNIVILCSGWKNTFCLEDSLCAGALVEALEMSGKFSPMCDAAVASFTLWQNSKTNLAEVVKEANHFQRLLKLGLHDDLRHSFRLNCSNAIPVWNGKGFVDNSERVKAFG